MKNPQTTGHRDRTPPEGILLYRNSTCQLPIWRKLHVQHGKPLFRPAIWYNIRDMKKAIITVVGRDTVGILAKTCAYLAKNNINILDISQTVVQDYFNMMMIVDIGRCTKPFEKMGGELSRLGLDMGLKIRCQKSEIFEKMHRV